MTPSECMRESLRELSDGDIASARIYALLYIGACVSARDG
jgi:hypothetical protein